MERERIKGINTETTYRNYGAEININGFASDAEASTSKTSADAPPPPPPPVPDFGKTISKQGKGRKKPITPLPFEVQKALNELGWRGSLMDVEKAWREDPERVRQWLWYVRRKNSSAALLRTVLRKQGEYPPYLESETDFSESGKSNERETEYIDSPQTEPSGNVTNPEMQYSAIDAEALYRKIRKNQLTLPRSDKYSASIEILKLYLQKHKGDLEAAARELRPFAEEADRRNISPLNLCWLAEWAAAGVMPPHRKNGQDWWKEQAEPIPEPEPAESEDKPTRPGEERLFALGSTEVRRRIRAVEEALDGNFHIHHMMHEEVLLVYDLLESGMSKEDVIKLCDRHHDEVMRLGRNGEPKYPGWEYELLESMAEEYQNQENQAEE